MSLAERLRCVSGWFDSHAEAARIDESRPRHIDLVRVLPFILIHVSVLGVVWVGWSWTAVGVAVGLYLVRMFAITGFYHRYFSHRSFKTSRVLQFVGAVLGNSAAQRGPLWWAAHHRHHHTCADTPEDVHSPVVHGFWWSHVGWFLANGNFRTRLERVQDYQAYPELMFIDRYDALAPLVLLVSVFLAGLGLETWLPQLHTNGPQLVIWGFSISTVLTYHATFTINSLDHLWGTRRYATPDRSRNNALLAVLTLGEGWHNNHHHYAGTARQGFFWWELDVTYYVIKLLEKCGLVWDVRGLPEKARAVSAG